MLTHLSKQFFSQKRHGKICIIGGGTGSMNLVGQFRKYKGIMDPDITPGWTMVAGGIFSAESTRKSTRDMFAPNVQLVQQKVKKIDPNNNLIFTESGDQWVYDHVIIASGINTDYTKIKGATEALDDPNSNVGSSYNYIYAQKMYQIIKNFQGGTFLFTEPQMPIKCGGAPQKILFLSEEQFRKNNIRNKCEIQFHCHKGVTFGVKKYSDILDGIHKQKGTIVNHNSNLIEIDRHNKMATFQDAVTNETTQLRYDALHVVPPQVAPKYIGLGDAAGFANVNEYTLQHREYTNIWSLGDSSSLPTSKTAAAVFSQTPVLLENLQAHMKNHKPSSGYDGYTSCPITVGDGKLLLAEFKYNGVVDETFIFDQKIPRSLFYRIKKDFFPWAYWQLVHRGYWYGRKGIIPAITAGMKSQKIIRFEGTNKDKNL